MRVNAQHQQEQEKTFEENLSFAQWLDYFSKEPTSQEIDDMERDYCKHTSINNTNYHPLQGA